ncbi:MAG: tetratricopeptide repeat protein [Leptolyngbyaceae cyanobacterium RM1_406_9]|nr:tetratricopeptide repeat protein [Leptolyngbyaceae cyanobacterium RM1_406_9]
MLTLFTQLASAQDSNSLVQQGREAFQSGEYIGAENFFRRAIQLTPDNVDALIGLGLVLWDQDTDAYYGLGDALYEQGKFADSISAYQEVFRRFPQAAFIEDRIRRSQLRLEQIHELSIR